MFTLVSGVVIHFRISKTRGIRLCSTVQSRSVVSADAFIFVILNFSASYLHFLRRWFALLSQKLQAAKDSVLLVFQRTIPSCKLAQAVYKNLQLVCRLETLIKQGEKAMNIILHLMASRFFFMENWKHQKRRNIHWQLSFGCICRVIVYKCADVQKSRAHKRVIGLIYLILSVV